MAADCLHTTYQPALKVHKPWSAWTVCNGKDTTCVCVCVSFRRSTVEVTRSHRFPSVLTEEELQAGTISGNEERGE